MTIRLFRKGEDEETYVRMFNRAFLDYDDIRSLTVQDAKALEDAPSYNLDGLFIADWNGQPVGMVQALVDKFREEKKGFIQTLAVLPEFRRRGIAKKLLFEAVSTLKRRGMVTAGAWAQTDKPICTHLYESFGFKLVRTTSLMKASLLETQETDTNETVSLKEAQTTSREDIALINKLDNEAFREHFNHRPVTVEETEYMLLKTPWYGHQTAWLAILENQPVGYIVAGIDMGLNKEKHVKYGWINDIGVLKPFRRQKIGATLMKTAMRYLKSREMVNALLYVDDQNVTGAAKLYETVSFKLCHRSAVYELQLV